MQEAALAHALESAVAPRDRYGFHVNALEHGRAVCQARRPRCSDCVLRRACHYAATQVG